MGRGPQDVKMCAQDTRYCTDTGQRLDKQPARQRSIRALDGVLRWVFTKMSEKKFGDRECLKGEPACRDRVVPENRKGISVILDVGNFFPDPRGRTGAGKARAWVNQQL